MSSTPPHTYRVGLAKCDITPPAGIQLAGFAGRDEPSTSVYHPLRAVAVAIDDGKTPILILMAEWLGFYDKTDRVRQCVADATGIAPRQIILSGTHTHCGPAVREIDAQRHGPIDHEYLTTAIDRMANCAAEAWHARQDAHLQFSTGHCTLARCRRTPDPSNPPKVHRNMQPYDRGKVDHEVPTLTIHSPQGQLRGVVFSYACHPTSRAGLDIGGDYVGYALDRVEQHYPGVIACFLQGCGGDQKPRPANPLANSFDSREIDQIREIGYELGDATIAAIDRQMLSPITGHITVEQQKFELHTEPLDDELAKRLLNTGRDYMRSWAQHQLTASEQGNPVSTAVPYELQMIHLGDTLAIVTMAAEMSVDYSLRLKEELREHFTHVLPLGYTNEIVGYIPSKRQIPEEGYEVWDANMYHQRTGPYVESTEDQIIFAIKQGLGLT